MEDLLPIIIGVPFGLAVLAWAIFDAGKLPGGQQPGNPARKEPTPARTDIPEKEPELLNGTELDAEEIETIGRVVRIKCKTNARINALEAHGLEITNLDKWNG